MKFNSVDEGVEFYKSYALAAGFNTRKSTSKRHTEKKLAFQYVLCNKQGFKEKKKPIVESILNDKEGQSKEGKISITRKRLVTRVGCKAFMVLKHCEDEKYIVTQSHEGHTHPLYTPSCNLFQKEGRKMNILHKKMIVDNSKVNIGPVKTFRMMKEILGVDDDSCLSRALWADPICKKNYALFGDMISFDTTYQTNRYNMVFTPFTGVDHHKSCITFAAGFIAKEDIESFEWLFKTFLKAMGNNEPNCLITNQDPAIKIVVNRVFQKSEHRFSEFEERWNKVMVEFELEGNEWLCYMYEIRDKWIPAYFRDVFLGGIMRTTSRSESENNFFCSFINPHVSLVEFYMRYEAAIDAQRHAQGQNDNDSKHKYLECKTPLGIEKYASTIYIISVFYDFQYEVEMACFSCGCEEFKRENGLEIAKFGRGDDEDIKDLVINLRGLRLDLEAKRNARSNGERNATNKEKDIELLIGASVPSEISIKPPKISKNKGTGVHMSNVETRSVETSNVETRSVETSNVETRSGSGKRLKGDKEMAVEQNQKKKRGYAKVVGN
ncbi:protein FAR1-RELATED SEQUENCE 5-like [Chenopodium quinoa]|uniref:protein FAR1-RELATED SEQUENCE 5-like n=1 Tax=Chenopodium quinoa TaxID=63459 RepID=UPI000B7953A6|nr:protein FAR1-RELATED SEQUENCE 5-like [Chenopodium quinoa]